MANRTFTVGSLIPGKQPTEPPLQVRQAAKQKQKADIRLLQNGQTFRVQRFRGNLLNEALKQGQAINFKCRKGTCGVCTVKVTDGSSFLSPPNEKERKKLKHALTEGCRLACQAAIE